MGHVFQGRYKAILVEKDSYLKVWLNVAPLSGEVRWTKRVARPASAAVVVKISRIARATCGMVVIGKLLACKHYGGCSNPIMP